MKRKYLIFLFVTIHFSAIGSPIDSLLDVFNTTSGVQKLKAYESLCNYNFYSKKPEAFDSTIDNALNECLENDSIALWCYFQRNLSFRLTNSGAYEEAEKVLREGLTIALEHDIKTEIPRMYLTLANTVDMLGRRNEFTKLQLLAYDGFLAINEIGNATKCLRNTAGAFMQLGNFPEAKKLLDKAKMITKERNYLPGYCYSLDKLIGYYTKLKLCDSALILSQELESIIDTFDKTYTRLMYIEIGKTHQCLGEYDLALEKYNMVLTINNLPVSYQARIFALKSYAFRKKERYDSALIYINRSLDIDVKNQRDRYKLFLKKAEILQHLKNYEKSAACFQKAYEEREIFLKESNNAKITELKKQYDSEKKDLEIALLKEENSTAEKERNWLWLTLGITSLLILALFFAGSLYYKKAKLRAESNMLLTKQKKEVEESLEEKRILLKEIHHRVKNNLQLISSIFNLQSKLSKGKTTEEVMTLAKARINTIALIHQKFYQSQTLSSISVENYLKDLTMNLTTSYNHNDVSVQVSFDIDDIELNMDELIPCGLVLNEIVSNIFKHGFTDENHLGKIDLLGRVENEYYKIKVRDNGVGIPSDFNIENARSLGMRLIHQIVVHQLDGAINFLNQNGTEIEFTFKIIHEEQ